MDRANLYFRISILWLAILMGILVMVLFFTEEDDPQDEGAGPKPGAFVLLLQLLQRLSTG
jgi:hypothetical protein